MFPGTNMQALVCFVHLFGISIITHCLSRRFLGVTLTSWEGCLSSITWPRTLALLIFLDSWFFLFASGMLTFGIGLEHSHHICSAAINLCIGFYATSKLLIYIFLIEKVHIVWSPTPGAPRFKSKVYIISFVTVGLYLVVIAFLLVGRIHHFRADNSCVIGLKTYSSIPLLSYDLYVNVFLTALFLWPLFRPGVISPWVKRVAVRTLVAATVALTTSTVNITILTIMKGSQLGWVCLSSCATDVVINAMALFWVTQGLDAKTLRSAAVGNSKGLIERDRRQTGIPGSIIGDEDAPEATKATLATNKPPAFVHCVSTASSPEHTRGEHGHDIELGCQGGAPASVLGPFADLFRSKSNGLPEGGLQITITTEYEHNEASSQYELDILSPSDESKRRPRK